MPNDAISPANLGKEKLETVAAEEENRLETTVEKYQEIIAETEERMSAMPGIYRENPDLLVEMMVQANNQIVYLKRGLSKPYFARIDFAEAPSKAAEAYYIGKLGVSDLENALVTVDWRAPIASLYYDSNLGEVQYEAPQGEVQGRLSLKRQFEIEQGRLACFRDVDTVANDALLEPYLGANADNRLKNIVASIQGEQNKIIREKIFRNLIVQGAAGSGKTTVALHRVAYLVYNYRDTIRPEQYLILGPNEFFMNYISSVLPDLDVNSVPESTFEQFAKTFLAEKFTMKDPAERLMCAINKQDEHSRIQSFQSSREYQQALDRFLSEWEEKIIPEEDFKIKGFLILPASKIKEAFLSLDSSVYDTLQSKVEKCINQFSSEIESNYDEISLRLSAAYRQYYSETESSKQAAELQAERAMIANCLRKGCRLSLKKYFSQARPKIIKLYRKFVETCPRFLPETFLETAKLQEETLLDLKKNRLSFEDLPAVLYLKVRIYGAAAYQNTRHTVLDEAQDFGEFHFFVLRKILSRSTFTIVGDLAQSIYEYRSIQSWEQVLEYSFAGKAEYLKMEKSYRTTVEIMTAANLVTAKLGLAPAVPVIRHGEKVRTLCSSRKTKAEDVGRLVREYQQSGYRSIAILSKTKEESEEIQEQCQAIGLPTEKMNADTLEYRGGLCTMTGYLSKGLEFDCVILNNASEAVYHSESRLDMHLLYVAMTRALHRLDLLFEGELCLALWELAEEKGC